MGPKRVPKRVQKGSKRGPKMGPPEVGTKKKSKNSFSLAPLWGVIQAPPSKNTVLGRYHLPRPCYRRFSKKKVRSPPPPEGWSRGGISALFFENRRQHDLGRQYLTEKVAEKGGKPPHQINGADPLLSQKNRRR